MMCRSFASYAFVYGVTAFSHILLKISCLIEIKDFHCKVLQLTDCMDNKSICSFIKKN